MMVVMTKKKILETRASLTLSLGISKTLNILTQMCNCDPYIVCSSLSYLLLCPTLL